MDYYIRKYKQNKLEWGMFLCLWLAGIIMSAIVTKDFFVAYDAEGYWLRGERIWREGNFSLLNIDCYRGYVYPLYLGICNHLGGKTGYIIINSFINSLFMVWIMPNLHRAERKDKTKCVICYGVFNLCFIGLSVYPLTDLFAIILCSTGIVVEAKIESEESVKKKIGYSFLLGVVIYCMYNVRTIYLFAGVALLLKLVIYIIRSRQKLILAMMLIGECMGGACASVPQIYMNYFATGAISAKVPTNGLMLLQVQWGISYQRYDTYIGQAVDHPNPQMYFIDPAGSRLLLSDGFSNWIDYIKFICRHPFDVAAIYIRHIVNVLFPCWPNQYVKDLDNYKVVLGMLSLLMFFLFGTAVVNKFINRNFISQYWILLMPVLFIVPGAVEVRFFTALYLMVIGTLCYNVKWLELWKYISINKVKIAVLFFIYGGLVLAIWTSMLASDPSCGIYMQ